MKKLVLLLSLALLSACGGSSSTTTTARTQPTDTAQVAADQNGTGSVSFKLSSAAAKRGATVTTGGFVTFGRIVITNPSLNDTASNTMYQVVKDFDIAAGPQLTVALPVKTGYMVEILEYTKTQNNFVTYSSGGAGYPRGPGFGTATTARAYSSNPYGIGSMTKYVVATFDMAAGGPTNVVGATGSTATSITLTTAVITPPTINFAAQTIPAIFGNNTGGKSFRVTANLNSATTPLAANYWGLRFGMTANAANGAYATMFTSLTSSLLYGPYSVETKPYYAAAVFYPKQSLVRQTETRDSFTYQLPATTGQVTVDGVNVTF